MNQRKGFLALLLTAFILGTFGIWIRQLALSFTNPGQVFARSLAATVIISLILLYKRINPFKLTVDQFKPLLIFSVVFPISLLSFTFAANNSKVSNALFMLYVGSLTGTLFLGRIFFKEKLTKIKIASLTLVLIGLAFFTYPFSVSSITLALIFGIVAGLTEAGSHTLRKLMNNVPREVIVFYQSVSAIVVALIFLLISRSPIATNITTTSIIVTIIFGALLVTIGYLLVYGFRNFDVNLGTVLLATELFFSLVVNYLFLKESPTSYELIGGIIIFLGANLTSLKIPQQEKLETINQ